MVVSKDSKRKRKESPPPQPPMIESSPEMPKRTKVQAQRKFAQGQNAPTSSAYATTLAASSSSTTTTTGPSGTSESREPPTEILPNKRPKTEDFLTFLCFRGTPALPAHLDFLNQGKGATAAATNAETAKKPLTKKQQTKLIKTPKKNAKKAGRKAKAKTNSSEVVAAIEAAATTTVDKQEEEPVASTSAAAAAAALLEDAAKQTNNVDNKMETVAIDAAAPQLDATVNAAESIAEDAVKIAEVTAESPSLIVAFAARKSAVEVPLGNRRARAPTEQNTSAELDNSTGATTAAKRRSNRAQNVKDTKTADVAADEEYDNIVADATAVAADIIVEQQSSANAKTAEVEAKVKKSKLTTSKTEVAVEHAAKEEKQQPLKAAKQPVKRPRQKESPIFIPSPEPTGRMTRQRAFFEPVKVPHREEENSEELRQAAEDETDSKNIMEEKTTKSTSTKKEALKELAQDVSIESAKDTSIETLKVTHKDSPKETFKGSTKGALKESVKDALKKAPPPQTPKLLKADVILQVDASDNTKNVFDFSSDDEQPLAKTIKLKKSPGAKKGLQQVKRQNKKLAGKKAAIKDEQIEQEQHVQHVIETEKELPPKEQKRATKIEKNKSNNAEEEIDEVEEYEKVSNKDLLQEKASDFEKTGVKKPKPMQKRPLKKLTQMPTTNGNNAEATTLASTPSPTRPTPRPTRKTKEAAAIYMGIIGQKLQQNDDDDEEDDFSLNSFPDLPCVKETEKMENELKKNNATASTASVKTTLTVVTSPKSPKSMKSLKSQKSPKPKSIAPPIAVVAAAVTSTTETDKPSRRGRPPKQSKVPPPPPAKREIEGMLVKKGALAKVLPKLQNNDSLNNVLATDVLSTAALPNVVVDVNDVVDTTIDAYTAAAVDEDDDDAAEDLLLNAELNETKRKLEKSFSDSDDEPLAIKAHHKPGDKTTTTAEDEELLATSVSDGKSLPAAAQIRSGSLNLLPTIACNKQALVAPPTTSNVYAPTICATPLQTNATPHSNLFKMAQEKKSPQATAKLLNVHGGSSFAMTSQTTTLHANNYHKIEHKLLPPTLSGSSYLPPASPHYQARNLNTAKSPTQPPPPPPPSVASMSTHTIAAPPPPSPLKYQTPPTTYPPPIEAYPSPKINPNFLTPKFDRSTLPRASNFHTPSPVKFELSPAALTATKTAPNTTLSPKTLHMQGGNALLTAATAVAGATTTSAAAAAAATSSDPLKDEIGSILAANLMPSKEESGKIFGIASVSLAQSSGPDNTKCTLGKCGSIHKPTLGPVVPTEGYIGDQLSSKERRKAKVNMTHEQIQKWLIECSSNPDEIQDDLEDDFDDNLRPNLFATTPPPTRDDKESTSFSSSSKATRDLGKSESAWSGKGPSLKAIPVVAVAATTTAATVAAAVLTTTTATASTFAPDADRDKEKFKTNVTSKELTPPQLTLLEIVTSKSVSKSTANHVDSKKARDKLDKKSEKKIVEANRDVKAVAAKTAEKVKEPTKTETLAACKATAAGKQSLTGGTNVEASSKQRKKNSNASAANSATNNKSEKSTVLAATPPPATALNTSQNAAASASTTPSSKLLKRTPVYNQSKSPKTSALKETTTSSHKKKSPFSYAFGAFSADNEKSVYSFDKDDDDVAADADKTASKAADKTLAKQQHFRRQSRQSQSGADAVAAAANNTTTEVGNAKSPSRKRSAAAAADRANKELANASQSSSVSLTLSPSENCKQGVKVSLGESAEQTKNKSGAKFKNKLDAAAVEAAADADSDSEGHTFYIPLQGAGSAGAAAGGIQGVAVKLGREGPEGPNQKVIMHATLVTKAQMRQNSKPLPDSMNASEIVKNLLSIGGGTAAAGAADTSKNDAASMPSTSAAAAAAAAEALKNVPVGTVQPRFKGSTAENTGAGGGLMRVNSNSSLFSGSAKSRGGAAAVSGSANNTNNLAKKFKDDTPIKMANNTAFPRHDDPTQMVEAPIFRPSEKEFADPMDFIERITPIAARFGICKIIPPANFKPECRISDEMRFTAYNQYVHKLLHRWGPSAKELSAIKKYLATQSIVMAHQPWIGGMEVDLPRLYHTVQELGGLKEVIEKKRWARVAEEMCIPKLAQDRVTKLDDIYCKYLLPYDTLSPAERQKLFDEVEADWAKREARARRNADRFVHAESVSNEQEDDMTTMRDGNVNNTADEEDEDDDGDDDSEEEELDGVSMECIVKGRSMPLSQFYRIARNTMTLWFKNTEPSVNEVEAEFWRHVAVRDSHVCVHSGSIDSSGWGYGFPSPGPKGKGSNYARHPWNLKVLTNNAGSVLRSLGPVMGVTVPTLHVGMLFAACCWYRDPHGLSWIEYLHTGASKLWYGIPDDQSSNFRTALTSLIPTHCQNKTIWLPCDTVMVPPHMLTDRGVSLCRIEQKPGEFIVVFPRAYTSSLATGYVVSESVYFATNSWLDLAKDDFRDIHDSCEPAMFSLEQLLFALGTDQRVSPDTLQQMLPMLNDVFEKETAAREQLKAAGVTATEKVGNEKNSKAKKQQPVKSIESECDLCRANLYISMVRTDEGNVYCLQHALKNLNNGNIQAKQCKIIYAYNSEDIENLIKNLNDKIQQKRAGVQHKKHK